VPPRRWPLVLKRREFTFNPEPLRSKDSDPGCANRPLNMKHSKKLGLPALGITLIGALATGCSGINVGKSFSPIDFILPGLMQNGPPPVSPLATNTPPLLAQAGRVPLQNQSYPNDLASLTSLAFTDHDGQ